jgi:hypothetical protein
MQLSFPAYTDLLSPADLVVRQRDRDLDDAKVAALADSMRESGWMGRPVLALLPDANASVQALTGHHRIAAAAQAGIDVPTYVLYTGDHQVVEQEDGLYDCALCPSGACWADALLDARTDDALLAAIEASGDEGAIALTRAEFAAPECAPEARP